MKNEETLPTTQRAYTLRLRGIDKNESSWHDALWATHEAVNKGAKVFGDWLLTLRGGLDHLLANEGSEAQRKDRRILLALSWLSVEDARGAPRDEALIVAQGTDSTDARERKLTDALAAILQSRGVGDTERGDWLSDCLPSLAAAIREDAVWVNRSGAFDALARQCPSLAREDVWDLLAPFFGSATAYLQPSESAADDEAGAAEEKAKDLVQKAGSWLSSRMGTGKGADFERMGRAYVIMATWAENATAGSAGAEALASLARHLRENGFAPSADDAAAVLSVISGPGYKSATRNQVAVIKGQSTVSHDDLKKLAELAQADAEESKKKIGGKGQRPYATMILQEVEAACGFTYLQPDGPARHSEFAVMLDHAARRVSITHSWIKNAEAERRQFENDTERLRNVPAGVRAWLEKYCQDRSGASGSLDDYRIRKRAIDGWEKVMDRWSRADCQSADDRIAAARQLQDDPEIDKFGDIQLFEALAGDDALDVWKPEGTPAAEPLKDFVSGAEAEAKKRRFKVPAYRHPDPLRHPIFTDFGNSRWEIDYSIHRAAAKLGDLPKKLARLKAALDDAERKLEKSTAAQREKRQQKAAECREKLRHAEQESQEIRERQRMMLKVWNGKNVEPKAFRWSCKRLVADLGLDHPNAAAPESRVGVSRADRLGRAALGADESSNLAITGLFEQDHWNGRLQAPRAQLDAIARHVERHGWDAKARAMIDRIRWLVSFSAKLTQQGPWLEYCKQFADDAPAKPFVSRKGEYAVKHQGNDQRKGHAKVILSRLPGLRVISVDLGHRFAAACAVWQAITPEQMRQACKDAGASLPIETSMHLHLQGKNAAGKPITAIYRRIGPDVLAGTTPHPAPWARLDRQFLIKLQGEERAARKALPAEIEAVESFEQWAGRRRSDDDPTRKLAVDALMSEAVRTARLALARHGRRARIARDLTATVRTLPGGRLLQLDDAGKLDLLIETLAEWHALASEFRWDDKPARELWNAELATLPGGFAIDSPTASPQTEEKPTKAQRRQTEETLKKRLRPLAEALFADESRCQQLHHDWSARWSADDEQWKQKLKWLSRWLMPRGRRRDPSRRHVGGLSLKRIGTLTEFRRKVQVGFFTRLRPDGSRAEIGKKFGQSTLDALERLKDQRIKQLASRIVEAALGVGIEQDPAWDDVKKKWRDPKRPRQRIDDPRFAPCHAVVIENLTNYRPEETRTRRENRATMDWKSAETKKRLADHCQLYGLLLRDVNPQYTSRQDSRTGAPGVRCADVSVRDFLNMPWWRKQVAQARKEAENNKGDARKRYLIALDDSFSNASEEEKAKAPPLRIPVAGGELFVSADPRSPLAKGIQADLNAAANIGLRALLDPDFSGRWWYVPCSETDGVPHADKVKGAICFGDDPRAFGALLKKDASPKPERPAKTRGKSPSNKSTKEIVNLWSDVSAQPLCNADSGGRWLPTPAYWKWVLKRVVGNLALRPNRNGLSEMDHLKEDDLETPF